MPWVMLAHRIWQYRSITFFLAGRCQAPFLIRFCDVNAVNRPKILIQLDTDPHPSSFDAIVAIDAGVNHLLQYGRVESATVAGLVHGAMFTRGGSDLANTAIFIGGSEVSAGESLLRAVKSCFFGPVRVSVLLDSNGCNTTAAAAVLTAWKHVELSECSALVLGGTGPVGRRVARLLRGIGCRVKLASRSLERAEEVAKALNGEAAGESLPAIVAAEIRSAQDVGASLADCQVLIAAGAAGIQFVKLDTLAQHPQLKVAIDLNAVPPLGIEGIAAIDKAVERSGQHRLRRLGGWRLEDENSPRGD
jgi:methylenetetrahydrofolate/methylenetetrahydromethanopterin dehydrogenase (NADP+)